MTTLSSFINTLYTEEGHVGLALLSVVLICIEYYVTSGAVGRVRG